jgi:hypothetical protein
MWPRSLLAIVPWSMRQEHRPWVRQSLRRAPCIPAVSGRGRATRSWLGYKAEFRPGNGIDGESAKFGDFIRGEGGRIIKTHPDNSRLAVERLGVTIRINEFTGQTEISGLPEFDGELTDAGAIRLRFAINERFDFLPSDQLHPCLWEAHGKHPCDRFRSLMLPNIRGHP